MEEKTNPKSKIVKGVLLVFIGALIGAIICGIATGNITLKNKTKSGDPSLLQSNNSKEENTIGTIEKEKDETEKNEDENIEENETDEENVPIDNYIKELSKINSKKATKEKGEMSINGIKIGMSREEVEKIMGQPEQLEGDEYEETTVTAIYGKDSSTAPVIQYDKKDGKYTVYSISISSENDKFKTDRDTKIGDTFETIISKYAKEEKVEPYEKSPNIYVLYGKEELEYNEEEGIVYQKTEQSQYATMYGFYDSGENNICLVVSYGYGQNSIDYFIKNGKVASITIGTREY